MQRRYQTKPGARDIIGKKMIPKRIPEQCCLKKKELVAAK